MTAASIAFRRPTRGSFERYCDTRGGIGPFDPESTTWDVTQCFQQLVIDNVPSAVFASICLLALWRYARREQSRYHVAVSAWTALHLAVKLTLIAGAGVLEYLLFLESPDNETENDEDVSSILVMARLVVLALVTLKTFAHHTRSRRSSDSLLISWLVTALCAGLAIKSAFHHARTSPDTMPVTLPYLGGLVGIALVAIGVEIIPKPLRGGDYERLRTDDHGEDALDAEEAAAAARTADLGAEAAAQHDSEPQESPEVTANIFSRLTFWWLTALMQKGRAQVLIHSDLWSLLDTETTEANYSSFDANWTAEMARATHAGVDPSLLRVMTKTFGPYFALGAVLKFSQDSLQFLQPQLLKRLIEHTSFETGVLISVMMLLTAVTQSMFVNAYFQLCMKTGMRIRSALSSAIYHKALRLSLNAKGTHSTGQLTTYMSVDVQKLLDLCTYLHIVWSGPFQIALALIFLWAQLGPAVLSGLAVMIIMVPVNAKFAKKQQALQKDQMRCKDNRLRLMDEFLSGIKVVKLYAWELFFLTKIDNVRQRELRNLKKYGWLAAATGFTWSCTPFVVSFASFATYTILMGHQLTPSKAFVSLSLFNLLQFPLAMFPSVISSCVESSVSIKRINEFLKLEEIHNSYLRRIPRPSVSSTLKSIAVRVKGSFAWRAAGDMPTTLSNLDLTFMNRELTIVLGKVGAGKSSLISAILGELEVTTPASFVELAGRVAYVSDESWILNDTIRNNVLFGNAMDEEWYSRVIHATCLDVDLGTLPDGDMCLVGEKGVSLSGGQKKRLSIARAVYSRRDVYLLDDPLSALDAHVGRAVFNQCFGAEGLLRDKCRILVTHQVHFAPKADLIVYIKEGRVSESGNFAHMQFLNGDVITMLNALTVPGASSDNEDDDEDEDPTLVRAAAKGGPSSSKGKALPAAAAGAASSSAMNKSPTAGGGQMLAESMATGSVRWGIYKLYLKACTWRGVALFTIASIAAQALSMSTNIWLQYSVANQVDSATFLSVYGSIGIGFAIASVFTVLAAWIICGISAANTLHTSMLARVAALPMSFFDRQPVGRILNRFSKDVNVVDEILPRSFMQMMRTFLNVASVIVLISAYTPSFLLIICPLMVIYYFVQRYYLSTSRELKRLESVSRSPIFSHFSETLDGIQVIRAYQQERRFAVECQRRIDYNLRAQYLSVSANRWLAVRLEFLGAIVVFSTAFLMVLSKAESSIIGLTMSYALVTTGALNWMVRQYCEIETNIVSVERIHEYCELETEAPSLLASRPSPIWPNRGEITFDGYSTRYREGLNLVLKNMSITIKPREKVGIVGRTGSGKSSTLLSIFRIIEAAEGQILIDGVDISQVGLFDLRSRLTIIPQDPVLFSGTVRQNLDPFQQHDDAALWEALDSVQLHQHVSQLPEKLSHLITHGTTFSMGQRQLLALARALLRRSTILFLDEATAQIDVETDRVIQQTIKTEFAHCTIVTIAHRINTVYDSDRILVLDSGTVKEFDTPAALMERPDSIFRALVEESNHHHH